MYLAFQCDLIPYITLCAQDRDAASFVIGRSLMTLAGPKGFLLIELKDTSRGGGGQGRHSDKNESMYWAVADLPQRREFEGNVQHNVQLLKRPIRHDMDRKQMHGLPVKKNSMLSLFLHLKSDEETVEVSEHGSTPPLVPERRRKRGTVSVAVSEAPREGLALDAAAMQLMKGIEPFLRDDLKVCGP